VFATFHRASLTADPSRLASVLSALGTIGLPVIFAVHPRTRAALGGDDWFARLPAAVHPRPPIGYLDTLACVRDASVVITDSGGVQREAYWLGTPCLTVREETEWTELVDAGANRLVPPDDAAAVLSRRAADALAAPRDWNRDAIGSGDAAIRIADAIHRFNSMSE
jgi:UDP-GlcNAc3NAcA epimerase